MQTGGQIVKNNKNTETFRKGDLLVMILVLLIAVFGVLFWKLGNRFDGQAAVTVYRDGELLWEAPLDQEGEYTVEGDYTNHIRVENGQAWVTESDCPGGDCVKSGKISEGGQTVICLPNKMELRIEGEEKE